MKRSKAYLALALLALLSLSAGSAYCQLYNNTYQFYPAPGYYNGNTLYYLMTDVSNQGYASTFKAKTGFNVNYSPLLANALNPALRVFTTIISPVTHLPISGIVEFMPSIYYVTNAPITLTPPQNLVFSAQWPVPEWVAGKITAIDSINKLVYLNTSVPGMPPTVPIAFLTDGSTIFKLNGAASTFAGLVVGQGAQAQLVKNAAGASLALQVIATSPPVVPPPPPFGRVDPGTYMPLWRLKLVTWNNPATATTLTSEAAILAAQTASKVTITDANTVVGASILINTNGVRTPIATVVNYGGSKLVRIPIKGVFSGGLVYKIVQLDFSDIGLATTFKGNWAPWLSRFNDLKLLAQPLVSQPIYSIWYQFVGNQMWVVSQVPSPFGPGNGNALYSPLMNDWALRPTVPVLYTSATQIITANVPRNATNYLEYEPVVGQ